MSGSGERVHQLSDLHKPQVESAERGAPLDRFLLDLALIQLAVLDAAVITRLELTAQEARISVRSAAGELRQLSPLRLDAGREELVNRTVVPLGLEGPKTWEPMSYIPYGSDLPWIEHWAALLSDIAMYASALREPPYRLRYRRIELHEEGDGMRQGVITVVDDGTDERAVTIIPIPVPALERDEVVGIGFGIREWIAWGEGEVLADGTRVKVFH